MQSSKCKIKKGFTLIELLIVMAVIALLVAIAVPAFRGMRQEAMTTRAQGDLKVIKIALESYYKSSGVYPTSEAIYQGALLGASPRILESPLKDPYTGSAYHYSLSPNGNYYIAFSPGPNGTSVGTGVTNDGIVSAEADDIWVSNGYRP